MSRELRDMLGVIVGQKWRRQLASPPPHQSAGERVRPASWKTQPVPD